MVTSWQPSAWTTTRQPEWDAEDKAIIYALLDYKADLCPGCGQPMSESLHQDGRDEKRYDAGFFECDGCTARERKQHEWDEKDKAAEKAKKFVARGARHWIVRRLKK